VPLDTLEAYAEWVTSYWTPLPTANSITIDALINRKDMHEVTDNSKFLALSKRLSKAEVDTLVSPEVLSRIGSLATFVPEVYGDCAHNALLNTDRKWDHLRVVAFWPDMSTWNCRLSFKIMSDMLNKAPADGKAWRDVQMVSLSNVNHSVSAFFPICYNCYAKLRLTIFSITMRSQRSLFVY
jgi:hypothetical protein